MKPNSKSPQFSVALLTAAVTACFAGTALGNPVNPTVVNGSAAFATTGNVLNVTNSNGAIINWQRFNIGAGETTRFIQSSASSAVLNRVLANDPSVILGNLTSNGRVWLVNPAGILVGAGGRIDTAGFVASTLNVTNADFLANRLKFESTPGAQSVINRGSITTPLGGSVYLVGKNVSNEGIITTPQGETILAAGNTVELIDSATPGVKVEITGAEGNATNLGAITAEAGRIGIAGVILRNSGTLNASSVVEDGGRIFLKASKDAYVDGAGRIITTGTKGGSIDVLGERVAVMDQAQLDASGENGGGKIRVGGDFQGKNPDVPNAQVTYFGSEASLKANAAKVGAGGTVMVWADDTTRAFGSIEAKGGTGGGNGGLVETSGKLSLDFGGARVDARAPKGSTGTWLLDPTSILLIAGAGTSSYGGGTFSGNPWLLTGGSGATIYGDTILNALGTSSVILTTSYGGTGNITFTAGVYDFSSANTTYGLSMLAYGNTVSFGNINLPSGTKITMPAGAPLKLVAGWDGASPTAPQVAAGLAAGYGGISVVGSSISLSAATGALTMVAGNGGISLDANSAIRAGGIALASYGGSVAIAGDHASLGTFTVYGSTGISVTDGGLASYGAMSLTTDGDIELRGINRGVRLKSSSTMSFNADDIRVYGGNVINGAGTTAFYGSSVQEDLSGRGAGVYVTSIGEQEIEADGEILLQAGSASGSSTGNSDYGGSVVIKTQGAQTVSAASLKVYGGATGHDNFATLAAYGDQTITLGSYGGSASLLWVQGGGTTGSYNNQASIEQQNSTGNQRITMYGAGAVLMVKAGAGAGTLGQVSSDCASVSGGCSGGSSNNSARIRSSGSSMEIDLYQGGTVSLYGGTAGINNHAEISFDSNSTNGLWIGSDGGASTLPSIALYGGTGGAIYGTYPNDAWLENSANIGAGTSYGGVTNNGYLSLDASAINMTGGAGPVGPAFIGATHTEVMVYGGNLTMTGGSGTATGKPPVVSGVAIGNDQATTVSVVVYGGSVILNGGSGANGAVMIGSLNSTANVTINAALGISATGGTGGVFVGSFATPTGSSVSLYGGSGNIAFDSASPVKAATLWAQGQGVIMRGANQITGSSSLTSYGSDASGDIQFNLGSGSIGTVSTTTHASTSQTIKFSGTAFNLSGIAADMEGDSLELYATAGNISFGSSTATTSGSITNAKNVTLNASGGIYDAIYGATTPNIDVSTYGGVVTLTATEIGLPYSYMTDIGYPIAINPGTGTISATTTTGGINLYQTSGVLTTSKYSLTNAAGNHAHLQSYGNLTVDSALNFSGRNLVLASIAGAVSQAAAAPITADLLAVSAYGGIDLFASNQVTTFSGANSTTGDLRFKNAGALTLSSNYNYNYGMGARNLAPNGGGSAGAVEVRTTSGDLSIQGGVQANGPITLRSAGNITQGSGQIWNDDTTGTNDISIYGGNLTLTGVSSQRNTILNATGDVLLVSSSYGYVDDSYFLYNMPFTFNFYGVPYTQAYITSNGLITFGGGTSSYSDSASGMASFTGIAPAWNDWIFRSSTGKDVFIKQPTSTSLAVQWNVARFSNESQTASFEAVLASNGGIRFNYGAANNSFAGDVTIGLSNGTTPLVSQLMSRASFSLNNLASTVFTPTGSSYSEVVGTTTSLTSMTSGNALGVSRIATSNTYGQSFYSIGSMSITAGGVLNAYSGIDAASLLATSVGGMSLSGSNTVDSVSLSNATSGDLVLNNTANPLTVAAITNGGTGAITVDNTGAIIVNGPVTGGGAIDGIAHSPITVNAGATISGGGNVTLSAMSSGATSSTDLLTIAGSISSSSGNLVLSGGSGVNVASTASLSVAAGQSIAATSSYGPVTVSPTAAISGTLTVSQSLSSAVPPTAGQDVINSITTGTSNAEQTPDDGQTFVPTSPAAGTATGNYSTVSVTGETTGGNSGTFGDTSGTTGSQSSQPEANGASSSESTEQTTEKADVKKDKEKKEQKSAEEKTEGRKNEKAASKKVAQCT